VPTYRDDRPLADDMSVAFRMIADEAPPPLPNPGNIGPRPVTSADGQDLLASATLTNLAAAGHVRAAASSAVNDGQAAAHMA
jgi:histidine ammonia-lyase